MDLRRLLSFWVIISFISTLIIPPQKAMGQMVLNLPRPGAMVSVSPNFTPALIMGLTVHKDNPFLFDFIIDPGQSKLSDDVLESESDQMIKYFFASLTLPDKDIWVNLSPYEKDRMIPVSLGKTAMGRDLLAQDYMLKQLTASLINPQKDLGKIFWAKIYAKAQEMYGTTQIPVNTFNKVWIVPANASVFEHGQTAFIVKGHLKVMLEEDYLSLTKHNAISSPSNAIGSDPSKAQVNKIGSQILREIILPEIEKEVNDGKNFATLRQIFYAQVLAVWFKRNLKEALLNRVYANKSTVKGIVQNDTATNEAIFHQYLRAYKKGVFNFIKEDIDPVTQETLPRKYFSGGYTLQGFIPSHAMISPRQVAAIAQRERRARIAQVELLTDSNAAMTTKQFVQGAVIISALGASLIGAGVYGKKIGIKEGSDSKTVKAANEAGILQGIDMADDINHGKKLIEGLVGKKLPPQDPKFYTHEDSNEKIVKETQEQVVDALNNGDDVVVGQRGHGWRIETKEGSPIASPSNHPFAPIFMFRVGGPGNKYQFGGEREYRAHTVTLENPHPKEYTFFVWKPKDPKQETQLITGKGGEFVLPIDNKENGPISHAMTAWHQAILSILAIAVLAPANLRQAQGATINPGLSNSTPSQTQIVTTPAANQDDVGGIDLSEENAALHVRKDINGGVRVDVDPVLIAQVERDGLHQAIPVIINMLSADMQSLLGVQASAQTP